MKKHGLGGAQLDMFNYEKTSSDHQGFDNLGSGITFSLENNDKIKKWAWKMFNVNYEKFTGEWFHLKLKGTLVAPAKGEYKLQLRSDDGSFLYLGKKALTPQKAFVKNGGLHGMVTKAQTVQLERGQPLDYTVVFYGN